jgi:hypothetical protein
LAAWDSHREARLRPLPLAAGAPLDLHERHPGARLRLVCGACAWSRSYDPARIIEGLLARRLGGGGTPVSEVARHVHWPCPRCRRMRWGTRFAAPEPS